MSEIKKGYYVFYNTIVGQYKIYSDLDYTQYNLLKTTQTQSFVGYFLTNEDAKDTIDILNKCHELAPKFNKLSSNEKENILIKARQKVFNIQVPVTQEQEPIGEMSIKPEYTKTGFINMLDQLAEKQTKKIREFVDVLKENIDIREEFIKSEYPDTIEKTSLVRITLDKLIDAVINETKIVEVDFEDSLVIDGKLNKKSSNYPKLLDSFLNKNIEIYYELIDSDPKFKEYMEDINSVQNLMRDLKDDLFKQRYKDIIPKQAKVMPFKTKENIGEKEIKEALQKISEELHLNLDSKDKDKVTLLNVNEFSRQDQELILQKLVEYGILESDSMDMFAEALDNVDSDSGQLVGGFQSDLDFESYMNIIQEICLELDINVDEVCSNEVENNTSKLNLNDLSEEKATKFLTLLEQKLKGF